MMGIVLPVSYSCALIVPRGTMHQGSPREVPIQGRYNIMCYCRGWIHYYYSGLTRSKPFRGWAIAERYGG